MKRAKMMLTAIALVTVVGGAFAFKAHTLANKKIFCQAANGQCTVEFVSITTDATLTTVANPCTRNSGKWEASSTTSNCSQDAVQFYSIAD